MKTEGEARQCWCPFAGSEGGRNRVSGISDKPTIYSHWRCIASECMAWRWQLPEFEYADGAARRGYCGLAGEP